MLKIVTVASVLAGLGLAATAQAQDAPAADMAAGNGTSFRGLRAEAQIGGDRFQSQGTHDDKFSYGGAIGYDGVIAEKFVVGPEFSYWRTRDENQTTVAGGTLATKSFRELGAGIRAGYLVQPKILVYGIGGYVNDKQRQAYTGVNGTGVGGFYNKGSTDGYQLGGGAEYSVTDNAYVGAGYRYSNYEDHTSRQRVFLSAGIRFKP